jgi:hypothetical protein
MYLLATPRLSEVVRGIAHSYKALWWPTKMPVLRLWGDQDRIVSQRAWGAPRFNTPNVDLFPPDKWIKSGNPGVRLRRRTHQKTPTQSVRQVAPSQPMSKWQPISTNTLRDTRPRAELAPRRGLERAMGIEPKGKMLPEL